MNDLERKLAASLQKAGEALTEAAGLLRADQTPGDSGNGNDNGGTASRRIDLLSGKQLGALHAISRRAGLSRDGLSQLVAELTGKRDLTQLTRSEASTVIDRLDERANS